MQRDPQPAGAMCAILEAMAIVWLLTPAIVAIVGFCAGLGFMSKCGREAVFVILRYTGPALAVARRAARSFAPDRPSAPLTPSELPNHLEHLLRLDLADPSGKVQMLW